MINVRPEILEEVKAILSQYLHGYQVWAFGSRVNNDPKSHADLDLAVVGDSPLPLQTYAQIKLAFEESSIPFRVDVVDWCRIAPSFQDIIRRNHDPLLFC